MTWLHYLALVAAGFGAGYINTLAGSGSLLTLPLLIFLGLPAPVANGTNRVAILLQNVVGVSSFHRRKVLDVRAGAWLALPAIAGSIVGARIAVEIDERVLRTTIGVLMLVMAAVIVVRPKRWLVGREDHHRGRPSPLQTLIFFAVGAYGGFIQAGVGIFLLAGLVLGAGFDLVRANAVKVFIVLCFTVFALGVFVMHDQVRWDLGLVLAIGNMAGAWVAARMAVERGVQFVRWVLVVVVVGSGVALLLGV